MKVTIKYGTIAPKMRDSAKVFRNTAIQKGVDERSAKILAQVAQDYENCAEYIETLEEKISELQIQAIRAQSVSAERCDWCAGTGIEPGPIGGLPCRRCGAADAA